MNLAHLKFVQATAEKKSFSRAAEICHVTQPTLSNGIAKLEAELGEKIFSRTTRMVATTPFGKLLLPTIASMLRLEGVIRLQAKEFANPVTVVSKIGMSPLVNTSFITHLTSSYKAQNTTHEIILIEDNLDDLQEKLNTQELDLILVPTPRKTSGRNSIALYDEDLFLIEQVEANTKSVAIDEIRDKTFVMVPNSCGLSEITRALLRTTRKEIKEYEGKALSYQVLADWASHGLGSAILPRSKILPHISKRQILKSDQSVKIYFEAKWLPNDSKSLKKLIRHFKDNIDQVVSGIAP